MRHRIKQQFAQACSEFLGKFNETNGDSLASVVFEKIVKNHVEVAKNRAFFFAFFTSVFGKTESLLHEVINLES